MNSNSSKKILTVLVVLLLLANVITITLFWVKKEHQPGLKNGGPAKFIIKELGFDEKQQVQFLALANEHQEAIAPIREELKQAKDDFFALLNAPNTKEEAKLTAAKKISSYTEKIDLITLDHFAKVRAMCNATQQQKFDSIIKQVTQMMAMPHPQGPNGHHGPPPMDGMPHDGFPPDGPEGEMPPPPPQN